jgi:hypothetical protein
MHTFRGVLERVPIRAVDICRLLTTILREYRKSGPLRADRFSPVEHFFEDI